MIPIMTTPKKIVNKAFVGNAFLTISRDGRLTAGNVIIKVTAGPVDKPAASKVCTTGISAAVGMTNKVPARAKPIITKISLPHSLPTVGNNHARANPKAKTTIK